MSVDLDSAASHYPLRSQSPTKFNEGVPSRSSTPAFEARMNALLQSKDFTKAASDGVNTAPPTPDLKPRTQTSSVPPPINRAGKPSIPPKPTNLSNRLDLPSTLNAEVEPYEHRISPFGTPPDSGQNSPQPDRDAFHHGGRTDSDTVSAGKPRTQSDASFVERVRTNSATSSLQRTRGDSGTSFVARVRGESNASFVEPSSLSESWSYPSASPVHSAPFAKPYRQSSTNGARAARYQPISGQSGNNVDEQSQDRPRLPVRPELQTRSGRTSPVKPRSGRTSPLKKVTRQRSLDEVKRAATIDVVSQPLRIPANKAPQRSALTLGFDMNVNADSPSGKVAPAVPPPRRSMDRRRDIVPVAPLVADPQATAEEIPGLIFDGTAPSTATTNDFPDSTQASRRAPKFKQRPWHIATDYDTRIFAVCGEYVCTTGSRTKAWSLRTGELLVDLEHHEIIKVSSLVFKPAASIDQEGLRIWLGTSLGDIHELDIPSRSIVKTQSGVHPRKEIIRMFRYASELWTLDVGGDLNVWRSDRKGTLSLDSQFDTFRTPRGHTFSIALGPHLWLATGKELRVFAPSASSDAEFRVSTGSISPPGTAEIHSGTTISHQPNFVYFGHSDGKVSIYDRRDFSCAGIIGVSLYKITCLAGVGQYLWAGFNTGMAYVYDTSMTPWRVVKDWQAHEKQICGINAEKSSIWKMDRLQVVTLGTDNALRIWDGMLEDDWLDSQMLRRNGEFCSFREITAAVLTWNVGASKPSYLQQSRDDDAFFQNYITSHDPPEIFVFGFQELVDLEDKKVTAKTFFKGKKRDADEQEHVGHRYRAWRDHLTRCLNDFMPSSQSYVLLSTLSLVGLFTCVFVKTSLRNRIKHVQGAEVKRGMGGMYGNKGALVLRMVLDDSSLCFVNCHLAAGQTQTIQRNNDVAAILESEVLPPNPLEVTSGIQHSDVFTSGGDGSMILDHEICILNGDLNYRIDTMGRDTVVKHIKQNNLWRLLERDQLLLSKKKNPGFRLRAFQESEIKFAPTYKYNVRTDEYDTSEKRRSPAWCDRILYRGAGSVKMEQYQRWEVRVSDHRPVSGRLRLRVKTVDAGKRAGVFEACCAEFEQVNKQVARAVQ